MWWAQSGKERRRVKGERTKGMSPVLHLGQLLHNKKTQVALKNNKMTDANVRSYGALPSPDDTKASLRATDDDLMFVQQSQQAVAAVMRGEDKRLLVIVGPCSVHCPEAVLEFARRLAEAQARLPSLLLVLRTYFEKPRTTTGWTGFATDPCLDGSHEVARGIHETRGLLLELTRMRVPCATEALSLILPQYIDDLISFACIGARTVESQPHRELASGLTSPVGVKNSSDGAVEHAVNCIHSARYPKAFIGVDSCGRAAAVKTRGNPNCFMVLRGSYTTGPNFEAHHIDAAVAALDGLNDGIIVDCSHGNSQKCHREQVRVARHCAANRHRHLRGVMLEAFLVAGRQDITPTLTYGQSITDACMDWAACEAVLEEFHCTGA